MFFLNVFLNIDLGYIILIGIGIILALILTLVLVFSHRYQKQIYKYAYLDQITGMKNIHWFNQKANELLKVKKEKKYVLLSFDVNNFKYINECYGREYGDKVLIFISNTIYKLIAQNGIFTRRDIDKFLVFIEYKNRSEIKNFHDEMSQLIKREIKDNLRFLIELCCGIYVLEPSDNDIEKASDRAEMARKEAKKDVQSDFIFYDDAMANRIHLEKIMEENMETALDNNEFEIYMQPQYNLENLNFFGVEALIRWNSSCLGFLYPDSFISFFEKNGFIKKIDFFVTKSICERFEKAYKENKRLFHISVNHSRVTILDDNYLIELEELISNYTFPKKMLEIEITETVFIDNHAHASEIIEGIKNLGLNVSMDDFGSGYSSLNILKKLSFNVIKIDRDFLDKTMDEKTLAIIKGIVNLAKDINVHVICEGVETKEQVDFLKSIGCDMAQGYYFAKPMKMVHFDALVEREPLI